MRKPAIILFLSALPALALTTFDDPANHAISAPSAFDGVASLSINGGVCSGALLSSGSAILTAAHCLVGATNVSARFDFDGGSLSYTAASWVSHPSFTSGPGGITGGDIAIIYLATIVDAAAQRYDIYRGNQELDPSNNPITMVGYGRQGLGANGDAAGSSGAIKRAGLNNYEVDPALYFVGSTLVSGAFLGFDFDNGSASQNVFGTLGNGSDEVFLGLGDSGGPSFLNGSIVGVHSWRARPSFSGGGSTDIDLVTNGSFGEVGADTRVSTYASWVDDQLAAVPEPGAYVLVSLGLLLIGARRRFTSAK